MTYVVILLVMMAAFTVVGWPLLSSGRDARREHRAASALDRLIGQRDAAYRAIKELEFEYDLGNLSESDYLGLRERYRSEAAATLRELDAATSAAAVASVNSPQAGLTCPSCGRETATGDRYCWSCGGQLDRQCANCGGVVQAGHQFCGSCGTRLETEA